MFIYLGIQKSNRESFSKEYPEFDEPYPSLALVQLKDLDKSPTLLPFFSSPRKFTTTLLLPNSRKRELYNILSLNRAKSWHC